MKILGLFGVLTFATYPSYVLADDDVEEVEEVEESEEYSEDEEDSDVESLGTRNVEQINCDDVNAQIKDLQSQLKSDPDVQPELDRLLYIKKRQCSRTGKNRPARNYARYQPTEVDIEGLEFEVEEGDVAEVELADAQVVTSGPSPRRGAPALSGRTSTNGAASGRRGNARAESKKAAVSSDVPETPESTEPENETTTDTEDVKQDSTDVSDTESTENTESKTSEPEAKSEPEPVEVEKKKLTPNLMAQRFASRANLGAASVSSKKETVKEVKVEKTAEELEKERAENLAKGLCGDGTKPNKFGCCSGEIFKEVKSLQFACCPSDGVGECHAPMKK